MHVKVLRRTGVTFANMSAATKAKTVAVLLTLMAVTALLVYFTGGIRLSYSHLMYVPIVLSGIAFGVQGGLSAAIIGGLFLGPFMPLNTSTGEMQEPVNWLF